MRLALALLCLAALLVPAACGDDAEPPAKTLASLCADYCAARPATCPKNDCENICLQDLQDCPSECLDALSALVSCVANRCPPDLETACAAETQALAACSPECG